MRILLDQGTPVPLRQALISQLLPGELRELSF